MLGRGWKIGLGGVLGVFLCCGEVFANGCAVGAKGDLIVPIQNEDVKLVSEKVTVDLSKYVGEAECIFRLRNLTDRALSFKMGFPFESWIERELTQYQSRGFRVYSSQKELPTEEVVQPTDTLREPFRMMRIWTMYFPPKADRIVRCTYNVAMYGGGSETGDPFPTGTSGFTYMVRTGALWSGYIDSADFKIILPWSVETIAPKGHRRVISIVPGDHSWEGHVVTWHFERWKPDVDIAIEAKTYTPLSSDELFQLMHAEMVVFAKRLHGYAGDTKLYTEKDVVIEDRQIFRDPDLQKLVAHDYERLQQLCVAYFRNEILAWHGYRFKDRNWQKIFSKEKGFKPQEHFSMSLLNGLEKKNLEFLTQYEKKRGWR